MTKEDREFIQNGFNALGQQIGALNQQVGSLNQRMGSVEQQMGTLNQQVGSLNQRVGSIEQQVSELKDGQKILDKKLDDTREDLKNFLRAGQEATKDAILRVQNELRASDKTIIKRVESLERSRQGVIRACQDKEEVA